MNNGWTAERRAKQAVLIHNWKPWVASSGPKTDRGKAISAVNAQKHGMRSQAAIREMQLLRRVIRACRELDQEI